MWYQRSLPKERVKISPYKISQINSLKYDKLTEFLLEMIIEEDNGNKTLRKLEI